MGRDGCLMLGWPVAASVGGGCSPGCRCCVFGAVLFYAVLLPAGCLWRDLGLN